METEIQANEPAIAETPAPTNEVKAVEAESAPAADETAAKPERDKVQERFDKLTREKYEERARAEMAEWRLAQIEQERQKIAKPDPVAPGKIPALADYEYDETRYQAAIAQYFAAEARKAALETLTSDRQATEAKSRVESWRTRESSFAAKTADYHDSVYARDVPINQDMANVLQEMDDGPAVAYYLAKNRDAAAAIAALPPLAAARELGKIEARISQPAAKPPPVSSAPPPPPKIQASEPAIQKEPQDMNASEFAKWRKRYMK